MVLLPNAGFWDGRITNLTPSVVLLFVILRQYLILQRTHTQNSCFTDSRCGFCGNDSNFLNMTQKFLLPGFEFKTYEELQRPAI